MFGKEDEDPFQGNGSQRKSRSRGASESDFAPRERETNARVKDLYRQLVRRLHPDHVADLSPKQIEWWHQAQAAYNEGNVEKLEMLLVLTDIEKIPLVFRRELAFKLGR